MLDDVVGSTVDTVVTTDDSVLDTVVTTGAIVVDTAVTTDPTVLDTVVTTGATVVDTVVTSEPTVLDAVVTSEETVLDAVPTMEDTVLDAVPTTDEAVPTTEETVEPPGSVGSVTDAGSGARPSFRNASGIVSDGESPAVAAWSPPAGTGTTVPPLAKAASMAWRPFGVDGSAR